MAKRASAEPRRTAGFLRLVAAHRHGGEQDRVVEFHPRLTVLAGSDPDLANWVTSLLDANFPTDTNFELDGAPATARDLQLLLRDATPSPLRVDALALLAGRAPEVRSTPPEKSAAAHLGKELDRWERVRRDAENRLVRAREHAGRVEPFDFTEAARLRNEWLHAVQLDRREHQRRTRHAVETRRQEYDRFLARFGATSSEELSVVGTGFGETSGDVAIREAATFVSMAEQRCARLRSALEGIRRFGSEPGDEPHVATTTHHLHDIDADAADRLLVRALARREYVRPIGPLVVDRVLDALNPVARRRACDRLLSHSSVRQVVIVTSCSAVAQWAARARAIDVSLTEVGDVEPANRVTT